MAGVSAGGIGADLGAMDQTAPTDDLTAGAIDQGTPPDTATAPPEPGATPPAGGTGGL